MDVTNIFTSGSMDFKEALNWDGMKEPPIGGLLLMPGGDVKIMLGAPDKDVEDMSLEEWGQVSTLLGYLMYALGRKDWMVDYMMYERELEGMIEEGFKEIERNRVRSTLRVIDGRKPDADAEDGEVLP